MNASFTPKGHRSGPWFTFDTDGRTLKTGFRSRAQAEAWIYGQLFPKAHADRAAHAPDRRA